MTFYEYLQNYGFTDTDDLVAILKKEGKTEEEIDSVVMNYAYTYENECKSVGEEEVYL